MTSPLDQSYRPSLLAPDPPAPADLYAAHAARSEARAAIERVATFRAGRKLIEEAERIVAEVMR